MNRPVDPAPRANYFTSQRPGHTRDTDCTIDPRTDSCVVCGVHHGDACPLCGGRGFHTDTCEHQRNDPAYEVDPISCIVCDGDALLLGSLGWMMHFRCRDCGLTFSQDGRS